MGRGWYTETNSTTDNNNSPVTLGHRWQQNSRCATYSWGHLHGVCLFSACVWVWRAHSVCPIRFLFQPLTGTDVFLPHWCSTKVCACVCVSVCVWQRCLCCTDNKEQISVILSFEPVTPAQLFMEQSPEAKSTWHTYIRNWCTHRGAHTYTHMQIHSYRITHVESSCLVLISTRWNADRVRL